jgi:ribonuclease Z
MKARKLLWGALIAVALVAAAGYATRETWSLALAKRVAAQRMAADPIKDLPDGLHIGLCGAGSPLPDEHRAGPCTLVLAGKRLFVFDVGSGSVRNIGKMGFNHGRIEALLLTHFHSDHIDGMGELMLQRWVSTSNAAPLPVHGPAGVETLVAGLMQTYSQDKAYRVAHHGDAIVPASGFGGVAKPFALPQPPALARVTVIKEADLEITAFAVDHAPVEPSVGYRINYKGRSVVLSGDTRKSANVQREAVGVDVLVHEALSEPMVMALKAGAKEAGRMNLVKIFDDIVGYHTSPQEAAQIAQEAKARYLLLNHIVPALPLPGMEAAFMGNAKLLFDGPVKVGRDGDFISLPAGTTQINVGSRF